MNRTSLVLVSGAALVALLALATCSDAEGARRSAASDELLDVAFAAASVYPTDPHQKDRARAQESVAQACLGLDLPERAEDCAARIDNWRRGACFADVARHHAEHGRAADARRCLARAEEVVRGFQEGDQTWRLDRIRARIARALLALGEREESARVGRDLVPSEVGALQAAAARSVDVDFDAQLAAFDRVFEIGEFDHAQNALWTCVELFDRFWADPARRQETARRVRHADEKLPALVRLQLLQALADRSLDHGDTAGALEILGAAAELLADGRWLAEHRVAFGAQLAALRHRAGDRDRARRKVEEALLTFEAARAAIVDIDRADALRPVAEAFAAIGEPARAREVYLQVLDEAMHNPNSRPRADDLVATCTSLALAGVEPDAALWQRIREVRGALGDPW